MAAGLTLARDNLARFQALFASEVDAMTTAAQLQGTLYTDGSLAAADLSLDLAECLRYAGPWGQAFPEPVFMNRFRICQRRIVGERHLKLKVSLNDHGPLTDAIAFRAVDRGWDSVGNWSDLAYKLDVNQYRGNRTVQLIIEHMEPAAQ